MESLPHFYDVSTVIRNPRSRPGMVSDAHTKSYTKPLANEQEHAMGFRTRTTIAPVFFEGQGHYMLGQAMNLHIVVWIVWFMLCVVTTSW